MKRIFTLLILGLLMFMPMQAQYVESPAPSITIVCEEPGTLTSVELPEDVWTFDHLFLKGRFAIEDLVAIKNAMAYKNVRTLNCKDAYFLKGEAADGTYHPMNVMEDGTYPREFLQARTIVMPKSLKKIVAWQNVECKHLMLPDGIERIEQYAFEWGGIDSYINLPASLKYIGAGAFYSAYLETLKMPDHLTIIQDTCLNVEKKVHLPANLEEISWNGFRFGGKSLTLPAKLRRIGPIGISAMNLEELHVLATEPPLCDKSLNEGEKWDHEMKWMGPSLSSVEKDKCVLYVPKGCVEKYRAAHEWGDFADIREEADDYVEDMTGFREWEGVEEEYSDNAAVDFITSPDNDGKPVYYDLHGRKSDKPTRGVNIVVSPSKTISKIISK